MANTCSFQRLVGGQCGKDPRARGSKKNDNISVPLLSCKKEILEHKRSLGLTAASGADTEVDLILARSSIFSYPPNISEMNICPAHRYSLGIGWRQGAARCRVPPQISKHVCKSRAADRGIGKELSRSILKLTGIFLPIGSGICSECRSNLVTIKFRTLESGISDITEGIHEISLGKEEFDGSSEHHTPPTPGGSFYAPPSDDESSSEEISFDSKQRKRLGPGTCREHLNAYLCSQDISPIRSQLQLSWQNTSDRTKRYYVRKAGQGLSALIQDIAPADAGSLYKAVCSSGVMERTLELAKEGNVTNTVDETMMNALAECYRAADDSWEMRRQILSIMADKLTLNQLRRWIPNLSQHCFTEAKRHCLVFGRGLPVHTTPSPRMKVSFAQIDHFVAFITSPHVVQDLPFGERRITLSNKEIVKVPNVVRMLIPERIVRQYIVYCQESQFKPLGHATLLRILNVCSASVRTSLQGLDYVSSAGAEAFDELCDVVETRGDAGQGMAWAKMQENNLRASKRYLKSDYKVHVSKTSSVADHCRSFALSDPREPFFQATCDHEHNNICERCAVLSSTLTMIEAGLTAQNQNLAVTVQEELKFRVKNAQNAILAWKAHLLCSVNQDEARVQVLEELDETSVFIVQDWAMKYLPRKFRESQTDWFGKRGIPWHLTVAMRRQRGELEILTFAHIFHTTSQDSRAVVAVMSDVIRQLKIIMSELKTVYYRQDNAGCYHCGLTLVCTPVLGLQYGVNIKRLDFSDPQGGKAACDRKAATIKSHMRIHLNAGNDIETPAQMRDAILSCGGVSAVNVVLCECVEISCQPSAKIEGISLINNVQFEESGIWIWRAYNLGPGKQIPKAKLHYPSISQLPVLTGVTRCNSCSFAPVKERRSQTTKPDLPLAAAAGQSEGEESIGKEGIFTCPEEGCIQTFLRYSSLQRHLDCGRHKRAVERDSLCDKAAVGYAQKLEMQYQAHPQISCSEQPSSMTDTLPQGWALKLSTSKRVRFTEKQRKFMVNKFQQGEKSGRKIDPASVARSMFTAVDSRGNRIFSSEDFLSASQIAGFFSRLASRKTLFGEEDREEALVAASHEAAIEEMTNVVAREFLPAHPVMWNGRNLCQMVSDSKLDKLPLAQLRDICADLNIDVEDIRIKRGQPYVEKIHAYCQTCIC